MKIQARTTLLALALASLAGTASAAVVWSDSFTGAADGSAPFRDYNNDSVNDWEVINKTGATASASAAIGSPGPGLQLLDTGGENTTVTARMDHFGAFDTASLATDTLRISFDWQISSYLATAQASAFRFGLRDGGTTRFSIGFGRSNVDGSAGSELYFFTDKSTGATGNPTTSGAIGWNGTSWDAGAKFADYSGTAANNTTGGFIHFEIVYVDQSTTATISLTSGAGTTSYLLTGVTASTFSNLGGDSFYFSSPGGGTGEAFVDNIVVEAYSSVPEPASAALLIGSVGLGCAALRRRR